jgi:hypothetical protein
MAWPWRLIPAASDNDPLVVIARAGGRSSNPWLLRYLKAELKRANLAYDELAERMKKHGVEEPRSSITAKLKRRTFSATFFIAALVAIGAEVARLEDI